MSPHALDGATLEKLISAAVAAPSVHEGQPWRFRLDPDTGTLEMRLTSAAAKGDGERALHLSAGASLFHLRVALAHFGWQQCVQLLRGADASLLAAVRLEDSVQGNPHDGLYDMMWRRSPLPSQRPAAGRELPAGLLARLSAAAEAEGARLHVPARDQAARLERLAIASQPERVRPEPASPLPEPGSDPVLAVLSTGADERADWLRAGQALAHVLLVATSGAVRSALLDWALRDGDLRDALRSTPADHAQMVIGLNASPEG